MERRRGKGALVMGELSFSGLKTLLADDSAPVRLVMKNYLGKLDIIPELAENGSEALQKLRENDFDIAFIDVHMPEMNGPEVVETIRKEAKDLPIIAMTTGDNQKQLQSCLESGYNAILLKPIMKENVFRMVEEFS